MSDHRARMIEQYLPLADGVARRYLYTSEPLDDLLQVARLGLLKAVDRFDPDRGNEFSTFAVPTIAGELKRYFRDRAWTVRPPRDVQELYLRVRRIRETLLQELGGEPTAGDVAARLGCGAEDVVAALEAGDAYAPRSLDAPVLSDDDSCTGIERLADRRRDLDRSTTAIALGQLGQLLDDRSWEVVRLRFEEDLLQREIGERVGCSQMHVSRILGDAIARMRDAADATGAAFT